jgi:hypothetical protein
MFGNRFILIVASIGLLTLVWAGGPAAAQAGSVSYVVTVDTAGLAGTAGFLEAELGTATPPATPSVTATMQSVVTDGALGAVTVATGAVSGSFSSPPLRLANDTAGSTPPNLSDLQQAFIYGTVLSFGLTFSGSEVNGGGSVPFSGTIFTFVLEDATQGGLNKGPLVGEAFDVFVNPDGSVTVSPNNPSSTSGPVPGYDPATGGFPHVTISLQATVPEPTSMVLLGMGVAAGAVSGRGRWRGRRAVRAA